MNGVVHVSIARRSKKTKNKLLLKLIDSTVCSVCQDYMYVPMITVCGHTYCYGCLTSWFTSNETAELSCPQCRASVNLEPVLNSVLQQWIKLLADTSEEKEKFVDGNVVDDSSVRATLSNISTLKKDMMEAEDKYKEDKKNGTLYGSVFSNSALAFIDDEDDGIARCSNCHWELDPDFEQEEGNVCPHCNTRIRNRVVARGNSNSTSTAAETGHRRNGFDSDEYSEGELEDLENDIERYHEDSERSIREIVSDKEDEGLSAQFNRRFPLPNRGRNFLHDDEAEEDEEAESEDEDEEPVAKPYKPGRRYNQADDDEEVGSDLESFIDDDEGDEEPVAMHGEYADDDSNSDQELIVLDDQDEGRDSDFYEHHDEGYASGDSLDDGSEIDDNHSIDVNDDDATGQQYRKKQKRYRVVLDGSDEE